MKSNDYRVVAGATRENESWMMFMRGPTRFTVTVRYTRIENTRFGKEYLPLIKNILMPESIRSDTSTNPTALVYSQCLPLLETLAPHTKIQGLTIEDLLHCPSYFLELVPDIGGLDIRIEVAESVTRGPSYDIAPMLTVDLPESCKGVPHLRASDVMIISSPENTNPEDFRESQGEVSTTSGEVRYFKPRLLGREVAFEREASILGQINKAGLRSGDIRMSNLVGIVVSDEQADMTVGMLLQWIPPSGMGPTLLSKDLWGQHDLHKKWHKQVIATVTKLHDYGIVWGDVNPGNIAIDDALIAWVIDFGGLNNPQFVDDDKMETIEGDWQGIRRIFEEWLPRRLNA